MLNCRSGPTLIYEPTAHFHSPQRSGYPAPFPHLQHTPQLPSSPLAPSPRRGSTSSTPTPMVNRRTSMADPSSATASTSSLIYPVDQSPTLSASDASPTRRNSGSSSPIPTTPVSPSSLAKGKGKAVAPKKMRKERQTKIQEHLKTVKPGSPSPSSSSSKSSSTFPSRPVAVVEPAKKITKGSRKKAGAVLDSSPTQTVAVVELPIANTSVTIAETARPANPVEDEDEVDVTTLADEEAEARFSKEKSQIMQRLASQGINPHPEVLDHALRTLDTTPKAGDEALTVQSFLYALSSPPRPKLYSPGTVVETPTRRQSDYPVTTFYSPSRGAPPRSHSFGVNGPPATPNAVPLQRASSSISPSHMGSFNTPAPAAPALQRTFSTPATKTSYSLALAPSPEIVTATPAARRNERLNAFASIPLRSTPNTMVAAEIQGMGRVAMARNVLVEHLGEATAEQAIAAASEPLQPLSFGTVSSIFGIENPVIDAFAAAASARQMEKASANEATTPPAVDDRLKLVRSWLDSPEMTDEESPETWSSIPREWDEDLPAFERDQRSLLPIQPVVESLSTQATEEEMEKMEVRVGGKSVRVLLRTKRRRAEQGEDLDDEVNPLEDSEQSDAGESDDEGMRPGSRRRNAPESPRHGEESDAHCICNRDDEGKRMVQCDDCRVWYHLQCLGIPSAKKLGKTWFCFRCDPDSTSTISPSKRARLGRQRQLTPVLTHREPTLVASALSPRARGHFYFDSATDLVLAPSPQSSPSRRGDGGQPRSPVLPAAPSTPQVGNNSRADYAPFSPLLYRSSRSRFASAAGTVFDDALPSNFNGGPWDGASLFGGGFDDHGALPSLDEEDLWRCSTPSRALSSATYGSWGEGGLATPATSHRRSRTSSIQTMLSHQVSSTPSQDFLSGLHHPQHHDHGYAQRLFGSPAQQPQPSLHGPYDSPSASRNRTISNSSSIRRNTLASSNIFHSPTLRHTNLPPQNHWATPSSTPRKPSPSRAGDHSGSYPKYALADQSPQMPQGSGMARTVSGLGIGFEER